MKRAITGAVAALTALGVLAAAIPASAQERNRDGRMDSRPMAQSRDGDAHGERHIGRDGQRARHNWRNYGNRNGYDGYRGTWRTGQRYSHYKDRRYVLNDYRSYDLPAPRRGYRYYRDTNGDVVMAAIATGIIGLILSDALNQNHRGR